MSDGGKGSARRPQQIDSDTYASRWDNIFKKEKAVLNDQIFTRELVDLLIEEERIACAKVAADFDNTHLSTNFGRVISRLIMERGKCQ